MFLAKFCIKTYLADNLGNVLTALKRLLEVYIFSRQILICFPCVFTKTIKLGFDVDATSRCLNGFYHYATCVELVVA